MPVTLEDIQTLIEQGKKQQARQLLKPLLKDEPSAQAWYIAALLVDDEAQKIKCLQRAIKLDALHTPSNRLLTEIQGSSVVRESGQTVDKAVADIELSSRDRKFEKIQSQKRQRRRRRGMGCLLSFALSSIICVVILSLVGMIPGTIGLVLKLSTGIDPVTEVEGVAIEAREDSLLQISPSSSQHLMGQDIFYIDHGYVQEYTFDTQANASYVVYLQFLSLNAHSLKKNTAIVDSEGNDISAECLSEKTSDQFDSGIAYSCWSSQSGTWALRILGIRGETIGGYIVGLQALES